MMWWHEHGWVIRVTASICAHVGSASPSAVSCERLRASAWLEKLAAACQSADSCRPVARGNTRKHTRYGYAGELLSFSWPRVRLELLQFVVRFSSWNCFHLTPNALCVGFRLFLLHCWDSSGCNLRWGGDAARPARFLALLVHGTRLLATAVVGTSSTCPKSEHSTCLSIDRRVKLRRVVNEARRAGLQYWKAAAASSHPQRAGCLSNQASSCRRWAGRDVLPRFLVLVVDSRLGVLGQNNNISHAPFPPFVLCSRHGGACICMPMFEVTSQHQGPNRIWPENACACTVTTVVWNRWCMALAKRENKQIGHDARRASATAPYAQGRTCAKQDQAHTSARAQNQTRSVGGATMHGRRTRQAGESVPT